MSIKVDRSRNADLWEPFVQGQRYELSEDVFLMRLDDQNNDLALVPAAQSRRMATHCYEQSGYYAAPDSIQAYRTSGSSSNWSNVAGVVEAGTILEPRKLDRFYQFSLWFGFQKTTIRYATLVSGEFKGTAVNVEDLHWNAARYMRER